MATTNHERVGKTLELLKTGLASFVGRQWPQSFLDDKRALKAMPPSQIFTIGHSNHPIDRFVDLLRQRGVTALADVRSTPYSRFNPQFSRQALERTLREAGIVYVFLGKELGARSKDTSCYENGKVRYGRIAKTELFRAGIERVKKGADTHRLALVCAEREPLECHRTLMVSRELEREGVSVTHIHGDGYLEAHSDAIVRLLGLVKLPTTDLIKTQNELIDDAYAKQEERVACVNQQRESKAAP